METDESKQKQPAIAGTLRKMDIQPGDDFLARYLFGVNRMKNAIIPQEKRLEYDRSFSPVFQNLLEAKFAREYVIRLMDKHTQDIEEGRDGIVQGHQININNSIDTELNMFFKDVFIRGTIAIDCLIKHTKYMGYGISFLFSENEEKTKKGLKGFPIPESDERFTRLKDMIHQTKKTWYTQFREMRRKIEHDGYKLPDIKYTVNNGKAIITYPLINEQTIREVVDVCWENLSNLCEEIIVYIISLQLPEHLIVVMIPTEYRNPNSPVKFEVRQREFPEANYSYS